MVNDGELDRRLEDAMHEELEREGEHIDDANLIAYRGGTLEGPLADAADRHLSSCADCRLLLEALRTPVTQSQVDRGLSAIEVRRLRPVWIGAGAIAAAAA